ncbi:hypothetical protein L7F22_056865 [Adiantum nelumboides]|nr:hypothetical protein [Adiantum nelumboides]
MAFLRGGVFFLVLVILFSTASALYSPSSDVVQLTSSNFKSQVLQSQGVVLVEFYASWCGHCKALVPTWEKVASVFKGIVKVAAVDADEHKSLAQEYEIKGFPTIKVFGVGNGPVDYQGPRDAKSIAEFGLKQVKVLLKDRLSGKSSSGSKSGASKKDGDKGPSLSVELTSSNFDKLVLGSNDLWLVEFFAPWCGHCKKLAPEWKKASKELKGKVKLGHIDCDVEKGVMSRFGVQGFPTILVFGAAKENPTPYEGARTASAIVNFALDHLETNAITPEVLELTGQDVLEKNCEPAAICFVAFLPDILDSKAEGRNKYLDIMKTVAEKFKRSAYGYAWAAAGKQPALEQALGVGGYGYPALVALNVKKSVYAPMRSAFEAEPIIEFVKDAGRGGKGNLPIQSLPTLEQAQAWDGKDAEIIEEDEFSLEDLMSE